MLTMLWPAGGTLAGEESPTGVPAADALLDCLEPPRPDPTLGLACPADGGYWMFHLDGTVSFTHGPDVFPAEDGGGEDATGSAIELASHRTVAPVCVSNPSTEYHTVVIYARAFDDTDRFASSESTIKSTILLAGGHLMDAAERTGDTARYIVLCDSGSAVRVFNAVLPTSMAADTFSTIRTDLRAQGFNNPLAKYLVYYDDAIPGCPPCAGMGEIYFDDSRAVTNDNNGDRGAMYGMVIDNLRWQTGLHEHAHNMGAVQHSAPHTTSAGHCNDGLDRMCYDDGGSTANYDPTVCAVEVFDCNGDDYFNRDPPAGSYLDTHWNLGWSGNRFLDFTPPTNTPPVMQSLSCSTSGSVEPVSVGCSFHATDVDSTKLRYQVDWGDGRYEFVPPSPGWATPGTTQTASEGRFTAGTYLLGVLARDDAGGQSPGLHFSFTVLPDPCKDVERQGHIDVGRPGSISVQIGGTGLAWPVPDIGPRPWQDVPVPAGCWGADFSANGWTDTPAGPLRQTDLDICWLDAAGAYLACDGTQAASAFVSGHVPSGASTARVWVNHGVMVDWELVMGET